MSNSSAEYSPALMLQCCQHLVFLPLTLRVGLDCQSNWENLGEGVLGWDEGAEAGCRLMHSEKGGTKTGGLVLGGQGSAGADTSPFILGEQLQPPGYIFGPLIEGGLSIPSAPPHYPMLVNYLLLGVRGYFPLQHSSFPMERTRQRENQVHWPHPAWCLGSFLNPKLTFWVSTYVTQRS